MSTQDHRSGNMTCLQMDIKEPLRVTFFNDGSKKDDIYEITADHSNKTFKVTHKQGQPGRIDKLLREFGFMPKV